MLAYTLEANFNITSWGNSNLIEDANLSLSFYLLEVSRVTNQPTGIIIHMEFYQFSVMQTK